MGKVFKEKWLKSHIEREHRLTETQPNMLETTTISSNNKRRKNGTCSPQHQPKTDYSNPSVSAYENHRNVIEGPGNVGKTYYELKLLEKVNNKRPIHLITRSPNQNLDYKTSFNIKQKDKHKGSVVIFDVMLGARNSAQIDEFFHQRET